MHTSLLVDLFPSPWTRQDKGLRLLSRQFQVISPKPLINLCLCFASPYIYSDDVLSHTNLVCVSYQLHTFFIFEFQYIIEVDILQGWAQNGASRNRSSNRSDLSLAGNFPLYHINLYHLSQARRDTLPSQRLYDLR